MDISVIAIKYMTCSHVNCPYHVKNCYKMGRSFKQVIGNNNLHVNEYQNSPVSNFVKHHNWASINIFEFFMHENRDCSKFTEPR